MSERIGFIGLGQLGLPIAMNLLEGGYDLTVYNRTASKAEPLVQRGARLANAPLETVSTGGIVVSLLWDTAAVESIVTSDGFLEKLGPGGVHISMCTGSPEDAKRLAALHQEHGSSYIEAPIFGRPETAVAKKLWIVHSGQKAAKDRIQPLLTAMGAQGVFDFGEEIGSASIVKIVGNFLIISAAGSLIEALAVVEKSGVDTKALVAMLMPMLFPGPIYQNYGKRIAEKTAPFQQFDIPLKDLGLFEAVAQHVDAPTPIVKTLLEFFESQPR